MIHTILKIATLGVGVAMIPPSYVPLSSLFAEDKTLEESVAALAALAIQCGESSPADEGQIDYTLPTAAPVREAYFILRDGPARKPDGKAGEGDLFGIGFGDGDGFHGKLGGSWEKDLAWDKVEGTRKAIAAIYNNLPASCKKY